MAGYSEKNLVEKLGIKPGTNIYIKNTPEGYLKILGDLPERVIILKRLMKDTDFIQYFTTEKKMLEQNFPVLKKNLKKTGMLWISWPKQTSSIRSDINENVVRDTGLKEGLVDVKVCAVDETWSGLKFVYRTKNR